MRKIIVAALIASLAVPAFAQDAPKAPQAIDYLAGQVAQLAKANAEASARIGMLMQEIERLRAEAKKPAEIKK